MIFAAVTTCNSDGWTRYGMRMVRSFARYWPAEIPLHVYSEDRLAVAVNPLPQWLVDFKARHRVNPAAHGKANGSYNYTRDCVRFAHKVAAVTDCALSSDADVLIWLDADTLTHAPVTVEWLRSLMPPDAYIAWLDRDRLYPECGFYMLSLKHPAHEQIMRRWIELYETDAVLAGNETHDCVSLQSVIREAQALHGIKVHSLSGERGRKHPHPFVNSRLAECLDHLKGPRKDKGRSHRSDLIGGTRPEAHWR
jgi:hypothetical protein